jgi:hypothetical protein
MTNPERVSKSGVEQLDDPRVDWLGIKFHKGFLSINTTRW